MDKEKVADYGSTTVGGGLGLDQIYSAINALLTDGATPDEWLALIRGIVLIVFGYFAWHRRQSS